MSHLTVSLWYTFRAYPSAPSPSSIDSSIAPHSSFQSSSQGIDHTYSYLSATFRTRCPTNHLSSSGLMSPGGLISIDTSEKKAVPNSNNYSHTSSLHPSLTQDSGVHGPESSTSSGSPSFARDNPFHDPFRDGDKPLGYFYPSSNGVQKGLQPATATHVDPPPATMNTIINLLPPVPTTNADPFAVEVVPNEILSQTPPLPAGLSGLRRGLQIPSRVGLITWGFGFPKVLDEHGVSKPHWKRFKHELKTFAKMNFRQWVTVLAASQGVTLVLGYTAGQPPRTARSRSMLLKAS